MEIKDRIAQIIKKKGLTSQQFAEMIDSQSSTISHILGGRNLPSFKIVYSILDKFPEINPDWLIFGREGMFREDISSNSSPLMPSEPVLSAKNPLSGTTSAQSNQGVNTPSVGMLFSPSIHIDNSEDGIITNVASEELKKDEISVNNALNKEQSEDIMANSKDINQDDNDLILPLYNSVEPNNKEDNNNNKPKQLDNTPQKVMVFYKDNTFEIFTPR